jgi:hypothetical protein
MSAVARGAESDPRVEKPEGSTSRAQSGQGAESSRKATSFR